jgi:hypothetical protein
MSVGENWTAQVVVQRSRSQLNEALHGAHVVYCKYQPSEANWLHDSINY